MGSNSRGGGTANRSTMTDEQAFELCHPDVRAALCSCVFEWSAAWALNYQRKNGSIATVKRLRTADANTIKKKQWKDVHGKPINSPCVSLRMGPLYT